MHQPRKIGGPQLSYNNNFMRAISAIIPKAQSEKQGLLFKEWIPLALIEPEWLNLINAYFESCKTTDKDKEDAENAENSNSAGNQHMENNGGEKRTHPMHTHVPTLVLVLLVLIAHHRVGP